MLKRLSLVAGCLGVVGLVTALAGARQVTPIRGKPMFTKFGHCFDAPSGSNPSRIVNHCSVTELWLVDMPVDTATAGNHTGYVYGKNAGPGNPIHCWVDAASPEGATDGYYMLGSRTAVDYGPLDFPTAAKSFLVWMPANGTLHTLCEVPSFGGVSGVTYTK
jgi:hypothetical protein